MWKKHNQSETRVPAGTSDSLCVRVALFLFFRSLLYRLFVFVPSFYFELLSLHILSQRTIFPRLCSNFYWNFYHGRSGAGQLDRQTQIHATRVTWLCQRFSCKQSFLFLTAVSHSMAFRLSLGHFSRPFRSQLIGQRLKKIRSRENFKKQWTFEKLCKITFT